MQLTLKIFYFLELWMPKWGKVDVFIWRITYENLASPIMTVSRRPTQYFVCHINILLDSDGTCLSLKFERYFKVQFLISYSVSYACFCSRELPSMCGVYMPIMYDVYSNIIKILVFNGIITRFWGLAHLGIGNFPMQLFFSYNENIMSLHCGLTFT